MIRVVKLSVIMLTVVMLSVIMLIVAMPFFGLAEVKNLFVTEMKRSESNLIKLFLHYQRCCEHILP
jgi:hypothetical protein